MQAIIKSKHQRFCNLLQGVKDRLGIKDPILDEMEDQMFDHYNVYMQKREELRTIIQQYEEKQKNIRNRIKGLQRPQYDLKHIHLVSAEVTE